MLLGVAAKLTLTHTLDSRSHMSSQLGVQCDDPFRLSHTGVDSLLKAYKIIGV